MGFCSIGPENMGDLSVIISPHAWTEELAIQQTQYPVTDIL